MNFLERLLDGVVVEWKTLGEVFQMRAGQHISASKIMQTVNDEYIYPCFGGNGVRGFVNKNSHDGAHLLIGRQGALCGNVQRMKGKFYATEHAVVVTASEQVNIDWAFHLLTIMNLNQYASQSAQPGLAVGKLQGLEIPIPPLKIQAEIVRILDTFTALTAELTAEMGDRKKQYNYYRDRLLSFEKGEAEWKTLGEIGEFTYGYAAKAQDSGDARFVRITDININGKLIATDLKYVDISGENERYLLKKDDLLMARTGATYGKTMIFEEDYPAIYAGFLIKLSFDERVIISKFYWHFAQSNFFWNQANRLVSGGGQPQFNANVLKDVKMLIPSLEEQARIVAILDKFDTLTTDLSEGLPREIALRQKQYDYYRDLLLTFPKHEEEQ